MGSVGQVQASSELDHHPFFGTISGIFDSQCVEPELLRTLFILAEFLNPTCVTV